jgi:hypothetical protein
MTQEVGCSRQRRGLENGVGSEALTGEGCRDGQGRGAVVAPSSFRCSCAREKGEWGKKGVVAAVKQRGKQRMEELTKYGPSTAARAGGGTPPAAGQRGSGGHWLRGRGATVSLGGGHCGEGGLRGKPERPVYTAVLGG